MSVSKAPMFQDPRTNPVGLGLGRGAVNLAPNYFQLLNICAIMHAMNSSEIASTATESASARRQIG